MDKKDLKKNQVLAEMLRDDEFRIFLDASVKNTEFQTVDGKPYIAKICASYLLQSDQQYTHADGSPHYHRIAKALGYAHGTIQYMFDENCRNSHIKSANKSRQESKIITPAKIASLAEENGLQLRQDILNSYFMNEEEIDKILFN
jgi:hypothetical protein